MFKKIFFPFNIGLAILIFVGIVICIWVIIYQINFKTEFSNAKIVNVEVIKIKAFGSKGYLLCSYNGKNYIERHVSFNHNIGDIIKMKYSEKRDELWSLGESPENTINFSIIITLIWISMMIAFNYLNNIGKFSHLK